MRRGAPALGVDSARRSGGGGCGARWAAGLGGRGGVLGGGRERQGRPRRRAASGPGTRLPGHRRAGPGPGEPRPSRGLPPCARQRFALPAAPGSVAVAGVVARQGERYLRSEVASAPSPTGPVMLSGENTVLNGVDSRVPYLPQLEFGPKPVCLIQGNGSVHL